MSEVKFALFKYSTSNNIGDEIQSIAARQFLPRVDYYIDRDRAGSWANHNQDERVKLIANGWFMSSPYEWPLTDKTLDPLLVSIHVNQTDPEVMKSFSSKESIDYINNHSPIGARGKSTLSLLSKAGLDSYFSGCMTLTIQKDQRIRKRDFMLAVSVSDESYEHIKENTSRKVIRINPYVDRGLGHLDKLRIAEYTLALYQSAACVVTTKLHTMLPCLALETPVLFLEENESFDPARFDGLTSLVNGVNKDNLLARKYKYDYNNPPANPPKYKKIRNQLIKTASGFTQHSPKGSFLRMVGVGELNSFETMVEQADPNAELSISELLRQIKRPVFSIIMPAYNAGRYLEEAVSGILDQSFTDFECIIVDDGSTDGSVERLFSKLVNEPRFSVIYQKNAGLSAARNCGYARARGEYVLFLDSDDRFSDQLLELIYEKVDGSHPDIVVYNHSVLDDKSGYVTDAVHELDELSRRGCVNPTLIADIIFNVFGNQVWTKAFKRNFLDKNNLTFIESLKRAEDIPFTYPALLLAKSIAVIDKPLVEYRVNTGSSNSDSMAPHYKDIFIALDKLYEYINSTTPEPQRYHRSFSRLFMENVYYNIYSLVLADVFEAELGLAAIYMKRLSISREDIVEQDSVDLRIYDAIKAADSRELLRLILSKEKDARFTSNLEANRHKLHILNLEAEIESKTKQIDELRREITTMEKKLDKVLRYPRKARSAINSILTLRKKQ